MLPTSGFRFMSYGVVVEDHLYDETLLDEGQDLAELIDKTGTIKILPCELTPYVQGKADTEEFNIEAEGVNSDDEPYQVKITSLSFITARYLGMEAHVHTVPRVKKGEIVMIFQYSDSVRPFYWCFFDNTQKLRRIDHYYLGVSGESKSSNPLKLGKNLYELLISPLKKLVRLSSSKVNGEVCGFSLDFSGKEGVLNIALDDHVKITLEKEKGKVTITNQNKASILIENGRIKIKGDKVDLNGDVKINGRKPKLE